MPIKACSVIQNDVKGHVAFVDRGECSFIAKVLNAERAGALAVIITDSHAHHDDIMIDMIKDSTDSKTFIPAYFLMGRDGAMIMNVIGQRRIGGALISLPFNMSQLSNKYRVNRPPWSVW